MSGFHGRLDLQVVALTGELQRSKDKVTELTNMINSKNKINWQKGFCGDPDWKTQWIPTSNKLSLSYPLFG